MIKIDGPELILEGEFGTLIKEVSRVIHAIAKTASEKFEEETDGEVDYNHIVEMILEELAQLKRFDVDGGISELPDEIKSEFLEELRKERDKNGHKPNFIDFDTSRPDPNVASKIIKSAIGDVFLDTRGDIDAEDLKAIKKAAKKKKKKKK